jgi:hypothetical protein
VDPADLTRNRGMLLADVRRAPGLDRRRPRPMRRVQLDLDGAGVALDESPERDVGRPLEREQVGAEVPGDDEALPSPTAAAACSTRAAKSTSLDASSTAR